MGIAKIKILHQTKMWSDSFSFGPNIKSCFIWLGSCFGGCDIPVEVDKLGVDLIIQFGHSDWSYDKKKGIRVLKSHYI